MRGSEFKPTDAERSLVENAAAFGLSQADIATQLGIDEKTLRKHFRVELSSGKFKVDMTSTNLYPIASKLRRSCCFYQASSSRGSSRSA
jgi:hypothetical protein